MTTKSKPKVFADEYRRCLFTSIAGYQELDRAKILVDLKSGGQMTFEFHAEHLATAALKILDENHVLTQPRFDPCPDCANKDVPLAEGEPSTYCDVCTERYNRFEMKDDS